MRRRRLLAAVGLASLLLAAGSGAAPKRLTWELLRHDTPLLMWVDTGHPVTLLLHNAGREAWSEGTGDHISYHWLRRDGATEVADGLRSILEAPVSPGETVEIQAVVQAPPRWGLFVLEWDLVREQVTWFGAPAGSQPLHLRVLVLRRSAVLTVGLLLGSLVLAVVARRRAAWIEPHGWPVATALPVVWTALALTALTVSFAELSRRQLWTGSGLLVVSTAALLALPVALLPRRWRWAGATALVGVVTVVALADLVYLRFFGTIVPVVAAAAAHQVGQIQGSVTSLMRPADTSLLLLPAAGMILALAWPRLPSQAPRRAGVVAVLTGLACVAGAGPATWALGRAMGDPAYADQLFSQEMLVAQWGVLNVHLFDIARTVRERVQVARPPRETIAETVAFFRGRPPAPAPAGLAAGANLIQVQVESLQGWVIGARVGGQEVTPFLNRLRGEALYFSNVFDQTGQGRSSDGEFIALNSLHSLDRGAVAFRRADNHFLALPALLRAHGYTTLSAHPFERGFWNRAVLHPRYGFQQMLFKRELGPGEVIGWGLADEPFFLRVAEHLRSLRPPFYAFLITLGLHHPFDEFPARHKVLEVGELAGTPLGSYLHAMHYFDASLAHLVAELERTALAERTVLAVYGDHESGVAPDAKWLRLLGAPKWEPSVLVREQQVPFFVSLPGRLASGERPVVGGQLDIAPTLLDVLGIGAPTSFLGRSLLTRQPFAVLSNGSTALGDRLLVTQGPDIPTEGACYALPGGQPRPLDECAAARAAGQQELVMSRRVVIHDLVPAVLLESEQALLQAGGK